MLRVDAMLLLARCKREQHRDEGVAIEVVALSFNSIPPIGT